MYDVVFMSSISFDIILVYKVLNMDIFFTNTLLRFRRPNWNPPPTPTLHTPSLCLWWMDALLGGLKVRTAIHYHYKAWKSQNYFYINPIVFI